MGSFPDQSVGGHFTLPENPVMSCSYLMWCTLKWNSPDVRGFVQDVAEIFKRRD